MEAAGKEKESGKRTLGELLKFWRGQRRLSQLDLALEAEISTRHLSFIETGRSSPSREMVMRLAEFLEIPLRERNLLLTAAGYAPFFTEKSMGDAELEATREAVGLILTGHQPFPALAINRHWALVKANEAVMPLMARAAPFLLDPPINVLRLTLHPQGLAPQILNYQEWRTHLLERVRRQIEISADSFLINLLAELAAYPVPDSVKDRTRNDKMLNIAVPLRLISGDKILSFFSTTTVFGTPIDITLSELAVESFFPADRETMEILRHNQNQKEIPNVGR